MSVREARIVVPTTTITNPHKEIISDLIREFGGFTGFNVFGGWLGPSGPEYEYGVAFDIAVPDNAETHDKLEALAKNIKERLKQDAVYLRLPNGEVKFI